MRRERADFSGIRACRVGACTEAGRGNGWGSGAGEGSPVGTDHGKEGELILPITQWLLIARQVIARTTNPDMHKQLLRELKILDQCSSPYIVDHYGSFLAERDSQVGILMEYCEGGSLDSLMDSMKTTGMRCSEHVLGRIASSVSPFAGGQRCRADVETGSERT